MMRVSHDAVDQMRRSEFEHGLHFALVFTALTVFAAIITMMAAWVLDPLKVATWVTIVFIVGGILVGVVLLWSFRRGQKFVSKWFDEQMEWSKLQYDMEREKLYPTKPPPIPDPTPVTSGVAQPELLGGFDIKDLDALCRALALGAKWTEERMIGYELTHTHEVLTKERYYALMQLYTGKGIIGERGGTGNKTGKLLIVDPAEMMRHLRNQTASASQNSHPSPTPPPQA